MPCSPYCTSCQQKLIKKLQAEKAYQEEIQFQEEMKSSWEKLKGFQGKNQRWPSKSSGKRKSQPVQEEAEAFWRNDKDFWRHDQLLWEKDRVLLDEDRVLWAEEVLWADETAFLEKKRAL
nr:PREDICTED: coiled-coil domain-containing protein 70 [Opisthocomus hoazin]